MRWRRQEEQCRASPRSAATLFATRFLGGLLTCWTDALQHTIESAPAALASARRSSGPSQKRLRKEPNRLHRPGELKCSVVSTPLGSSCRSILLQQTSRTSSCRRLTRNLMASRSMLSSSRPGSDRSHECVDKGRRCTGCTERESYTRCSGSCPVPVTMCREVHQELKLLKSELSRFPRLCGVGR